MRIKDLCGQHRGQPVYVVGTGPSARLFPFDLLRQQVSIGLNQAWRYWPHTYSITVHTELVEEYLREAPADQVTQWIIKRKAPFLREFDDPGYYVFQTRQGDLTTIQTDDSPDALYLGRGIQQTAMHMAAIMGASAIYLIGVDMCDLGGDHHGHDQHVRFHGLPPADVYAEYREHTAQVRRKIEQEYGIPTLSLSPLLGTGHAEEDYRRLLHERGMKPLPTPTDTSPYLRDPKSLTIRKSQ